MLLPADRTTAARPPSGRSSSQLAISERRHASSSDVASHVEKQRPVRLTSHPRSAAVVPAIAVLAALALAGCGGDDSPAASPAPESAAESSHAMPTTPDSPLIAGKRYVSNKFRPGLTFTLPDGAWVGQDTHGGITMRYLPSAPDPAGHPEHQPHQQGVRPAPRRAHDRRRHPRAVGLRELARAPPPYDGLQAGSGDGRRAARRAGRHHAEIVPRPSPGRVRPAGGASVPPGVVRRARRGRLSQEHQDPLPRPRRRRAASSSSRRSPTPSTPSPRSGPS